MGKGGMKGFHELELQGFVEYWGLDHESYQALTSLPMHAQIDTMAKFSPKPGTRDVKGLFMSFLRSMSVPMGGMGGMGGMKGCGGKGFGAPMRPMGGRIAQ